MFAGEIITAISLGLIGGVIPGPVITAVFTEILNAGLQKALRIIFFAMLIETLVAFISLVFFSSLGLNEGVFRGLSFLGAAVLIWIALSIWRIKTLDSGERAVFSFAKITLMILSNGVLWTYWITICIPKAILLSKQIQFGDYLFMLLVQIGWLVSTLLVALLFSRFRILLSRPKIIPVAFKFFSLVFIYFALDMTWKSIDFFLHR